LVRTGGAFVTHYAGAFGGVGNDYSGGIAVGSDGAPVIGGSFEFALDFDLASSRAFTLTSGGDSDGFLLKLAPNGAFTWARQLGGYRGDAVADVALDAADNIYAPGSFVDFVDFDPLDGSYILYTEQQHVFTGRYTPGGAFGWASSVSGTADAFSYSTGVAAGTDGRVVTVGNANAAGGTIDFDPTENTVSPIATGTEAGFVWSLSQKAIPQATILGLPTGAATEGATLALAASVTDADSAYFTYSWTASKGGIDVGTGSGPVFALNLPDQGTYTITLRVVDESGNADVRTATVLATNAAPVLNGTTFANVATPFTGAPVAASGDNTGSVVVAGGGYVLVGVPLRGATDAGAVDVYTSAGAFLRTLTAPAPVAGELFGSAVAVVGSYVVVGAPGTGAATGAAYVFDLTTGAYVRTITGPGTAAGDRFGAAVAAFGNFVAVGAPNRDADGGTDVGAAYLFDPASGAHLQTFRNPTPQTGDQFGTAIVAVGGNLLIGAPGDDAAGLNAGAAYLFEPGLARVVRTVTNPNPTFAGSTFGSVLAASGTRAAVGAPLDDSGGTDAGGVYLFDLNPASVTFGALLRTFRNPGTLPTDSRFGVSLAFNGTRLLVGAERDDTTTADSGTVFLIDADLGSAGVGTAVATFKELPTAAANDRFGAAVAFVGDDVLIGAPTDDTTPTDSGRVFRYNATGFVKLSATSVVENGTVTVSGSFADAGTGDAHRAIIDWRDGTRTTIDLNPGVFTFSANHQYLDDAPSGTASDVYAIDVRVLDVTSDVYAADLNPAGTDAVRRFDGTTGTPLAGLLASGASGVAGATEIGGFATGPDGLLYVLYRGGGNPVVRFDPATGANLGTLIAAGPTSGFATNGLAFDAAGNVVIFDPSAGYFRRYDARTGAPVAAPTGFLSAFNDPSPTGATFYMTRGWAFGPDGSLYVANQLNLLGTVVFSIERFDGTTGAHLGTVPTGANVFLNTTDLAFGPTGDLFLMADSINSARTVYQLDTATGDVVREFTVAGVPFGNDGFLVTGDGAVLVQDYLGTITRFDGTTGEALGTFAAPPAGGLIAAGFLAEVDPQDAATAALTVTNFVPTVVVHDEKNAAGATGTYTLRADVTEIGTRDTLTYSWTITGATVFGGNTGPTVNFTPTGSASAVTLTVTDDDLGTVTTTTQVLFGTAAGDTVTLTNTTYKVNAGATTNYATGTGRVIVYGLAGNDLISAAGITSTTLAVELIGGHGNDTLVGGAAGDVLIGNNTGDYGTSLATATDDHGADSLVGGAGNDTLDGGLGDDTMAGGTGNDYYPQVPGSADLLTESGGDGTDTIDYRLAYFGITFSLGRTDVAQVVNPDDVPLDQHTVTVQGQFENLFGSTYGDQLSGSSGANLLYGGGGADQLFGDTRDLTSDTQFGGVLLETLTAITGDGNDTLVGGSGADTVIGGTGNDIIFGGDLLITLSGTTAPVAPPPVAAPDTGSNSLIGGTGNDTVIGGTGNDIIFGGDLLATLPGVYQQPPLVPPPPGAPPLLIPPIPLPPAIPDNDSIIGGQGNDTILGGTGNDIIFGGDLLLTLPGSVAPPPVAPTAPPETNTIIGGLGADTIVGGTGNDIIFGGDLLLSLPGVTAPTTPPQVDTSPNTLIGGTGNDTIVGGTGNDIIFGGDLLISLSGATLPPAPPAPAVPETNTIIGGLGADTIVGGTGNDIIFGGDLLISLAGATAPAAPLVPDSAPNSLIGGAGNDTIIGGAGNDIIFGGDLLISLSGAAAPTTQTAPAVPETNTIIGGLGSDTVIGGTGNDIIFGGDLLVSLAGATAPPTPPQVDTSPNSLIGGTGNDTIIGGTGNDIIFGGDLLISLSGATAPTAPAAPDENTLIGGQGNDTVIGGTGNDIIFGGDLLISLPGTVAPVAPPAPEPATATNSLVGGAGNDTIVGGTGNDIIFGGAGDDALQGGAGADLYEGGSGSDVVVEATDGDIALNPTQLVVNGVAERFYDIERAILVGGASANLIDASAFTGGVTLSGGGGNDTLIGSAFADYLFGGDGDDSLVGGTGADVLDPGAGSDVSDGGAGNDAYLLQLGGGQTILDASGIDSIDLSTAGFGVVADLAAGTIKFAGQTANIVTLLGAIENVRGTSYNDAIAGDADRNILEGGGGLDALDGRAGADTVQGSFPQVIYLDFDSGTNKGEHVYTIEERNQIQERLERAFPAPLSVSFTQTAPSVGRFSTMVFNAGEAEALVAGVAGEIDWRNTNAASQAAVNVNGFLGARGLPAATSANYVNLTFTVAAHELAHLFGLRHADAFGPVGSGVYAGAGTRTAANEYQPAAFTGVLPGEFTPSTVYALDRSPILVAPVTQEGNAQANPFVAPFGTVFAGGAAVATFTVGETGLVQVTPAAGAQHLVTGGTLDAETGVLTLRWATFAPAGTEVRATYQYDRFRPGYRGPDDATETPLHIMASPGSVGSTIAHAVGETFFGERELIKLAFDDASGTVHETALPTATVPTFGPARVIGSLPGLAVPNLLPSFAQNAGQHLQVRATNVLGSIGLTAGGTSENDVYVIQAQAGDLLTAEIYSESLRHRFANTIDSIIRVYGPTSPTDPTPVLLDYFGRPAVNDDGIDNTDSVLQDVRITADGTYYIVVDTFALAPTTQFDTDTGGYELFVYTFTPNTSGLPRMAGGGDLLTGGADSDVLIGSAGDDVFDGDLNEDVFIGYSVDQDTEGVPNTAPTATVTLNDPAPRTNDVLTATATVTDADDDTVSVTFNWYVNGDLVQSTGPTLTLTDTFDLASAGDYGDAVTVEVVADDGTAQSAPATAGATVANSAPVAADRAVQVDEDGYVEFYADADADGHALTAQIVTAPQHGTVTFDEILGLFTYAPDADYFGPDSFAYTLSDGIATSALGTVTVAVVPQNDPPTATPQLVVTNEDAPATITLSGTDPDAGTALAFVVTSLPTRGTLYDGAHQITLFEAEAGYTVGGPLTYVPNADTNGTDAFTFYASDGTYASNLATVTIDVAAVNDAPALMNDLIVVDEDSFGEVDVLANDRPGPASALDEAAQSLVVTKLNGVAVVAGQSVATAHGTAMLLANGQVRYTPNADYNGADSFTYEATDDGTPAASNTATGLVVINPANDAPTASDGGASTAEDTPLLIDLRALVADVETADADLTYEIVTGPSAMAGSLAPTATNGVFAFTPAPDFSGSTALTFRVTDRGDPDGAPGAPGYSGPLSSSVRTFAITITPVNDAPVALARTATTAEDTAVSGTALALDVDSANLTYSVVTGPAHGTLVLNANGSFTYTPHADYYGDDSFTYRAFDGADYSNAALVSITVTPVNDAPTATDDSATVAEDGAVAVDVLANDSDIDSAAVTVLAVTQGAHGSVAFTAGGVTYTSDADYYGSDSFTYTISDGSGGFATATVSVTVSPVNDAPVATGESFTTDEDTALSGSVLGNDTDIDSPLLTAELASGPAHGALVLNADGTFTYTPDADYFGGDSFTYRAFDGQAYSNVATVALTVAPVNDAPTFAPLGDVTLDEDAPDQTILITGVLAGPANEAGQFVNVVAVSNNLALVPHPVVVGVGANRMLTFRPVADAHGTATITVTATDDQGASFARTFTITVDPVADAPAVPPYIPPFVAVEDQPITGVLPAYDADGAGVTFAIVGTPVGGTVELNPVTGAFTFTPDANFEGTASFQYTVSNATGTTAPATVSIVIAAVNDAPVAAPQAVSVSEDGTFSGTVSAFDPDAGDSVTFALVSGPAHGTLAFNPDGSFTYTPNADYYGDDSFAFTATDGTLVSNEALVSITVTPVNDAPVATGESFTTDEDTALSGSVLGNDTDIDSPLLTAELASDAAHGDLVLTADGTFTYTPHADYFGSDSFTYRASDGADYSNVVTVSLTVNAVNDAPTATAGSATTDEDAALGGTVTGADIDSTGLTFTLESGPTHGTLTFHPDGSYTYTPHANYYGPDRFQFRASDGDLTSAAADFDITVIPVNDAPTAGDDTYSVTEDGILIVTAPGVLGNDGDLDDATLAAAVLVGPAHGALALGTDGAFAYTPHANYYGSDSFTYTASDGHGGTATATVYLTVDAVNDAPTATDDSATVAEDGAVTVDVLANDSDIDSAAVTVLAVTQGAHGSVAFTAGGVTYTPDADYYGSDSFTYTISDGSGGFATATVSVTVSPVNDAPVATGDTFTTNEDTALSGSVLGNDTDIDSPALTAQLLTGPAHGALAFNPDGSFTYTPDADYSGGDGFTYRAFDGAAYSAAVTVSITVSAVNDAPVASGATFTTDEDTALSGSVSATDIDSANLTYSVVTGPAHGALVLNADGTFTYTPHANYHGPDSFTFRASDGAAFSNVAGVALTVTAVNDAPTASAGTFATVAGVALVVDLRALVADAETGDDALGYTISGASGVSVAPVAGQPGRFTVTPDANFTGTASFTYTVSDGSASASAVVQIEVTAQGNVYLSGGDLYVFGTAGADTVHISADGAGVQVTINGASAGTFAPTGVVRVFGGDGDDLITVGEGVTLPAVLAGEAGNDTLVGGAGNDTLLGGAGNDSLRATTGDDYLDGGTGNDTVRAGAGNDLLYGGDGDDSMMAHTGNDTLHGGAGNDTLRAGAGDDYLDGGTGNDSLIGASGADVLHGGDGDDTLVGGSGVDQLFGGAGNDSLVGGSGRDTLDGGTGNDTLRAGSGVDVMFGGDGHDWMFGGAGADTLDGGAGNDTISAGAGDDVVYAGLGNDSVLGGAGGDIVFGGDGNDILDGGSGDDILLGGAGNDLLIGGSGFDLLIGGFGSDELVGNANDDVLIAGTTTYDDNQTALKAIRAAWAGSGTYSQRTAALQSTSFAYRLVADVTVLDDNAADLLTGSTGSDWFFANLNGSGARDCVTDLGNNEIATDTDY
jgi:VCBS repeat-containing protein